MPIQQQDTHEREEDPAEPIQWQRILERLSTLFLTGHVFSLNVGFLSECCGKQSMFILQERPRRVVQTCCRRVESLVVECLEICSVSGQRYPSILTLEVEGCISAAPDRQHRLLVSLRDAGEKEQENPEADPDTTNNRILHYAPDSLISWLEGAGDPDGADVVYS